MKIALLSEAQIVRLSLFLILLSSDSGKIQLLHLNLGLVVLLALMPNTLLDEFYLISHAIWVLMGMKASLESQSLSDMVLTIQFLFITLLKRVLLPLKLPSLSLRGLEQLLLP